MPSLDADSWIWKNLIGHCSWVQSRVNGMSVRTDGCLLVVDSGLRSDTFNKILVPSQPDAESEVDMGERISAAATAFEASGRLFTLWTAEGAPLYTEQGQCKEADYMKRLGFACTERETGMWAKLADVPNSDGNLPIVRVCDEASLAAFVTVLGANWEPSDPDVALFFRKAAPLLMSEGSPMELFVVWAGDEPAACGELFLSEGGQVAGVHMVSCRREYRRQGFGSAVTSGVLEAGRRAGAGVAVLLASSQGLPLYERMGFMRTTAFVEYAVEQEVYFCG